MYENIVRNTLRLMEFMATTREFIIKYNDTYSDRIYKFLVKTKDQIIEFIRKFFS